MTKIEKIANLVQISNYLYSKIHGLEKLDKETFSKITETDAKVRKKIIEEVTSIQFLNELDQ